MTRPLEVVIVNGSPSEQSKTAALAELITRTLAEHLPLSVRRIDVYALGPSFTGATSRADLDAVAENELRHVEQADLIVAASPVYRGSYSAMFKHLFDLLEIYALANKPVILAATGGSDRHALVIEHALRPLLGFFQAAVAPVGFYVSSGDFDGTTVLNGEVYSRIEVGLRDIIPQLNALTHEAAAIGSELTKTAPTSIR